MGGRCRPVFRADGHLEEELDLPDLLGIIGNFREMFRHFGLKFRHLAFKGHPASGDLHVQTLQLDVQWPEKIANLMDLLPYLFELFFHLNMSVHCRFYPSPET